MFLLLTYYWSAKKKTRYKTHARFWGINWLVIKLSAKLACMVSEESRDRLVFHSGEICGETSDFWNHCETKIYFLKAKVM